MAKSSITNYYYFVLYNSLFFRLWIDPFVHGVVCVVVAYVLAPTQFIKVICQETGKNYSVIIQHYVQGGMYRCFYAGAHMYALRQFISSFAFGFAQWLFQLSLNYYPITHPVLSIGWACCLAGVVETMVTLPSEIKEIAANKGSLMKRKAEYNDILTPLLIRNTLASVAAIAAYELTKEQNSPFMNIMVGTVIGIVVSALTMPFDLVLTQNCGSEIRMTWVGRLKQNILVEKKLRVIFNGLTIRIVQLVPYSIAHSMVMFYLAKLAA